MIVQRFGGHHRCRTDMLPLLDEGFDLRPLDRIVHLAEAAIVSHYIGVSPSAISLIMHCLPSLLWESYTTHGVIESRLEGRAGLMMQLRVILHFIFVALIYILFQLCPCEWGFGVLGRCR